MTELMELSKQLTAKEQDVIETRKQIQQRIRNGETTGWKARDFALAGGSGTDEQALEVIERFIHELTEHAGETVLAVLTSVPNAQGDRKHTEVRLGTLCANVTFSFDDHGLQGLRLCDRYAVLMPDNGVMVIDQPMFYSPVSGVLRPNPAHQSISGVRIGDANVTRAFEGRLPYKQEDLMALMHVLTPGSGLQPPITKTIPIPPRATAPVAPPPIPADADAKRDYF